MQIREAPYDAAGLFCNCGASDLGYAKAGFRFRVLAEIEPLRLAVALANHRQAEGVLGDLRKTWKDAVRAWRKKCGDARPALVTACPPCQGMSTLRSRRGRETDPSSDGSSDGRNVLPMAAGELILELEPEMAVIENVPGFFRRRIRNPSGAGAKSPAELFMELVSAEYETYRLTTDMADHGVPQTRKRVLLTCIRRDGPAAGRLGNRIPWPRAERGEGTGKTHMTLGEALKRHAERAEKNGRTDPEGLLERTPEWPERLRKRVAAIPHGSGGSAYENDRCPRCGRIEEDRRAASCRKCGAELPRPVTGKGRDARLVHGYRRGAYQRQRPDAPAAPVTTASGKLGSTLTLHPEEDRVLTASECAMLQTFPGDFDWSPALQPPRLTAIRAMIGEALPPRFSEAHGRVLRMLLDPGAPEVPTMDPEDRRYSRSCAESGTGPAHGAG